MAGPGIVIRTEFTVEVFPQRINRLTDSPDGPVGLAVKAKAEEMVPIAAGKIGTEYSGTTGKITDGRQGRMRDSGSVVPIGGASYAVVFNHPAANIHHQGAKAHTFDGDKWYANPHPNTWNVAGGKRRFRKLGPFSHPGHDANPFLLDAAVAVGLRPSGELRRGARQVPIVRNPGFF